MLRLTFDKFDEETQERVRALIEAWVGPPVEAKMPEGWKLVSEMGGLANVGHYDVLYLQGGIALGGGWKPLPEGFEHDVAARAAAYERTREAGQPTKVIATYRTGQFPKLKTHHVEICEFYEKDGKVFIAMDVDHRRVEQEVRHPRDAAGGEMRVSDAKTDL